MEAAFGTPDTTAPDRCAFFATTIFNDTHTTRSGRAGPAPLLRSGPDSRSPHRRLRRRQRQRHRYHHHDQHFRHSRRFPLPVPGGLRPHPGSTRARPNTHGRASSHCTRTGTLAGTGTGAYILALSSAGARTDASANTSAHASTHASTHADPGPGTSAHPCTVTGPRADHACGE